MRDSELELTEAQTRIEAALKLAMSYGQIDGSHHKMWVIDQMVRELTFCPTVLMTNNWTADGTPYDFEGLGESDEYKQFCLDSRGDYHPDEYDDYDYSEWDTGSAP